MPVPYINKLVKEGKGSRAELEKKWDKAKGIADEEGHGGDYAYITGIFKRMAGVDKKASAMDILDLILHKTAYTALGAPTDESGSSDPALTQYNVGTGLGIMTDSTDARVQANDQTENSMGMTAGRMSGIDTNKQVTTDKDTDLVPEARSEADNAAASAQDVNKDTISYEGP